MSQLVIAAIGPASSVQDGGRTGAQRYGLVPTERVATRESPLVGRPTATRATWLASEPSFHE